MKRSHLIRLQDLDVFSAPTSLGLKILPAKSTISGGLVQKGLHPLASHYAQNTIVEIVGFTDWVTKVLQINGELPRRGYWSKSTKDLERKMYE